MGNRSNLRFLSCLRCGTFGDCSNQDEQDSDACGYEANISNGLVCFVVLWICIDKNTHFVDLLVSPQKSSSTADHKQDAYNEEGLVHRTTIKSSPSSPMDVMMKSSPRVRRIRIVERPYDVLVTDSTPGKECTSSASYGLGQIPDKGTK